MRASLLRKGSVNKVGLCFCLVAFIVCVVSSHVFGFCVVCGMWELCESFPAVTRLTVYRRPQYRRWSDLQESGSIKIVAGPSLGCLCSGSLWSIDLVLCMQFSICMSFRLVQSACLDEH